MRILITGGAGFIGMNLCKKLLSLGHEVICMDDFSTSWLHVHVNRMISEHGKKFKFVHHDVQTPYDVDCDRIYNLACPASPAHYQRDPVRTIKTAFLGTLNALENSTRHNARLLLTSTSEVYGDPEVSPQAETYLGNVNTLGIRACYDEGKRAAESLAFSWASQNDSDVRIARLFNCYGPYMGAGDGRLIPAFITQALRNVPITVFGDGKQTRSFCYVDDTVSGLIALMEMVRTEVDKPFVCNIGNNDEQEVLRMAFEIQTTVGSDAGIDFRPLPQDDPKRRCPDLSKAKKYLGWEPTTPLEVGLEKTIEWFRQGNYLKCASQCFMGNGLSGTGHSISKDFGLTPGGSPDLKFLFSQWLEALPGLATKSIFIRDKGQGFERGKGAVFTTSRPSTTTSRLQFTMVFVPGTNLTFFV